LQTSRNSHYGGGQRFYFFRDWFYPIYQNHSGIATFNRYFDLLAKYFPKREITVGGGESACFGAAILSPHALSPCWRWGVGVLWGSDLVPARARATPSATA
jgi:hypothetical protein